MQYSSAQKHPATCTNSDAGSFPCLNSNISIEIPPDQSKSALPKLSTQHRKTAFILKESVQQLCEKYGIERVGMLTLTFRDHITSPKKAQKRFNSFISNVVKPRYHDYVGVMERMKSGRIHYHLLIALAVDIRSGFDFEAVDRHDYRSATPALRSEWAFLRKAAPAHGFGRTELLPIKSTTEAVAKYVGKYIAKHMDARQEQDKGARLVRYSRGARAGTTRFSFKSPGSAEWRRKLAIFAEIVQCGHPDTIVNKLEDLTRVLGPRWAHTHRDYILGLP